MWTFQFNSGPVWGAVVINVDLQVCAMSAHAQIGD